MSGALDSLLAQLERLRQDWRDQSRPRAGGGDNFRCIACEGCRGCRFCVECEDCEECNYCELCVECSVCTQCRACVGCRHTSHSAYSADCVECSYATLCIDCEKCVQCFACVGLRQEEFCFLNERLPRKEFFARVAELRAELDARASQGWLPEWMTPEDDAPPPVVEPEPAIVPPPAIEPAAAPAPPPALERPREPRADRTLDRGVPVTTASPTIARARRPGDVAERPRAVARPGATVRTARRPARR